MKKLRKGKFSENISHKDWKNQQFVQAVIKKCHRMIQLKLFNVCVILSNHNQKKSSITCVFFSRCLVILSLILFASFTFRLLIQ